MWCCSRSDSLWKHPRLRGEDLFLRLLLLTGMETPPLTRGRLEISLGGSASVGNTPAYAGKTDRILKKYSATGKHPRLRGEDAPKPSPNGPLEETPPLTRGRRDYGVKKAAAEGNTPAYAGKTTLEKPHLKRFEKHPRLRGEDSPRKYTGEVRPETPPLTRGRLLRWARRPVWTRNTPAYAGKTYPEELHQ